MCQVETSTQRGIVGRPHGLSVRLRRHESEILGGLGRISRRQLGVRIHRGRDRFQSVETVALKDRTDITRLGQGNGTFLSTVTLKTVPMFGYAEEIDQQC